jgi:hypothetical protein
MALMRSCFSSQPGGWFPQPNCNPPVCMAPAHGLLSHKPAQLCYTCPMPPRTPPPLLLALVLFLAACQPVILPISTATLTPLPAAESALNTPAVSPLNPPSTQTPLPTSTLAPTLTLLQTATPLPAALFLDPSMWQYWPVLPVVPQHVRDIYQVGQSLGNDPHAFSVFGDCQSEPQGFLGLYATDPQALAALPPGLQETVKWFSASLNRPSPTVRGGTTTGALLWAQWHQNKFTCTIYETPLQCELRIHKPSFVIIHVGTHYENRNADYMRIILDQLIAAGVVPILASKADDREQDDHVNAQYAQLAVEYNLPFWNFWAAVGSLPERGLYTRPDAAYQGNLYLTDAAAAIQRLTALQALDLVRRAVTAP